MDAVAVIVYVRQIPRALPWAFSLSWQPRASPWAFSLSCLRHLKKAGEFTRALAMSLQPGTSAGSYRAIVGRAANQNRAVCFLSWGPP